MNIINLDVTNETTLAEIIEEGSISAVEKLLKDCREGKISKHGALSRIYEVSKTYFEAQFSKN